MNSLPSILLDLAAWDAASLPEQDSAARAVISGLPRGFAFDKLSIHRLGGQAHNIAMFRFEDARFALLPGHPSAPLGYDRAQPFVPSAAQADDWKLTEEEYDLRLDRYLDGYLSPLRRVPIAPFLCEVVAREFQYGQNGDDQAEGYGRIVAACAPDFRLPTCDEWEYACAASTRSLFRWGDETPGSDSYAEKNWTLHKQPNAFGLKMNSSTYDSELCQGPKLRGGDGGGSVCGGMGVLASWIPLASSFQVSDDEVDGWLIDNVYVRRVRSLSP